MARPAPGVDPASWVWFWGAKSINAGEGVFSEFIRDYTAAQYFIRFGEQLDPNEIQAASDAIGQAVISDVLRLNDLPSIELLADRDASATAQSSFNGDEAVWSGNLLFILLGYSEPYRRTILEDRADTYDLLALLKSSSDASGSIFSSLSAFLSVLGEAFESVITAAGGPIGALSTLSDAFSIDSENLKLLQDAYGVDVANTFVLNLAAFTDIVLGTIENDDGMAGTSSADVMNGGKGDDVLLWSASTDIMDGGDGFDTADFSADTNARNFLIESRPGLAVFVAEVSNQGVFGGRLSDYLFGIEKILGTKQDDAFTIASFSQGAKLAEIDAGEGYDKLDFSRLEEGVVVDFSDGTSDVDGKSISFSNFEYIIGTNQDDVFFLTGLESKVDGGQGIDRVDFSKSEIEEISVELNDVEEIIGSSGKDIINTFKGENFVAGGDGMDEISTGAGNDILYGGDAQGGEDGASDTLTGGSGADTFYVGDGDKITDADAEDLSVFLNGVRLTGPMAAEPKGSCSEDEDDGGEDDDLGENEFRGEDGAIYKFSGDPATGSSLTVTITLDGATITIEDWDNGDFGWEIAEEEETNDSQDEAECNADPILIDLDGDGIEIQGINDGRVYFDYLSTEFAQRTAWVTGDDGILAVDLNGDGAITYGAEIFGDAEAGLGFDGLAAYDTNGDGQVDASDESFGALLVWQDVNADGTSEPNELFTLSALRIISVSLELSDQQVDLGSGVEQTGGGEVTFADGTTAGTAEVLFGASAHLTDYRGDTVADSDLSDLPYLNGYGTVLDLDIAMTEDPELRAQVEALASLGIEDAAEFGARVENIIYRWHRVEDVADDTRGDFIDGQQLAALEQLFGEAYLNDAVTGAGADPRSAAGSLLQDGWDNYYSNVTARLLAQSDLGSILFPELGYYGNAILQVEDGTSIATVMNRMANEVPTGGDSFEALSYWKSMILAISAVEEQFVESGPDFAATVDALLTSYDLPYGYSELRYSQIAQEGGDTLVGRSSFDGSEASEFGDLFVSGDGDDRIIDSGGSNTLVFGEGRGNDTIEGGFGGSNFTIDLQGLNATDIEVSYGGRDGRIVVITINSSGETLTIENALNFNRTDFLSDIVLRFEDGTEVDLTLPGAIEVGEATDGDDTLFGSLGDDDLAGGVGDDFLSGGAGSDTYRFGVGDGADTIVDNGRPEDTDTIVIGANFSDVQADFNDGDYILTLPDGSQLTVESGVNIEVYQFTDQAVSGQDLEVALELASRTFTGDAGDNTLEGTFEDEFFEGGRGNDFLVGDGGADTYIYNRGDGADIIEDDGDTVIRNGVQEDFDAILIQGYTPAEVTLSRIIDDNDDLVLTFAENGDSITIRNQLEWERAPEIDNPDHSGTTFRSSDEIEQIIFEDGTTWTVETLRQMLIDQSVTSGDDFVQGFDRVDDTLWGDSGTDTLEGGSGDDKYRVSQRDGADTIIEATGAGSDAGSDTLVLVDFDPSSLAVNRDGSDVVLTFSDAPGDSVRITNQILVTQIGTVITSASPTVETIVFEQAGLTLSARELLDLSFVEEQTSGDDIITGTGFSETLLLGDGNDQASGGRGDDVYLRDGQAGGDDVINDGGIITTDTLRLTNVVPDSVSIIVDGESLVVGLPNGSVRLVNQRDSLGWDTIEFIVFDDGTVWDLAAISAAAAPLGGTENTVLGSAADETLLGTNDDDTIGGDAGNDVLEAGDGNDLYLWGSGSGNDRIQERGSDARFTADRLQFTDLNESDIEVTRTSRTELSVTSLFTGEVLTLDGQFGDTNNAIEYFVFADGAIWDLETIRGAAWERGTDGVDTLSGNLSPIMFGGLGDDTLNGGFRQDNTYVIRRDDGNDVIDDFDGIDTLRLEGVERGELTFEASTANAFGDVIIHIAGSDDTVFVRGQLRENSEYGLEQIILDDGTVITEAEIAASAFVASTEFNDTIVGTNAAEQFRGGLGDDELDGGRGDDSYFWESGDGNDIIDDNGRSSETDTLVLTDIADENEILLQRGAGFGDLTLTVLATGETLLIEDSSIETIRFADGSGLDIRDASETLPYIGTDEDDSLFGNFGSDVLIGGLGDDYLVGDGGGDTYVYASGDGRDIIEEYSSSNGTDILQFSDINVNDVQFSRGLFASRDLEIEIISTGEIITIYDQFSTEEAGLEQIRFADGGVLLLSDLAETLVLSGTQGDDFLQGGVYSEIIEGGLGNDFLQGLDGDDTYIWSSGDGFDVIADRGALGDQDTLDLTSIGVDDVTFVRGVRDPNTFELPDNFENSDTESFGTSYDLLILINSTGEILTIEGQFAPLSLTGARDEDEGEFEGSSGLSTHQIEIFAFADGSLTSSDISNLIAGGAEIIVGDDGEDILDGGVGNDTLAGGNGNDVYVFDRSYGKDQIFDTGGETDSVRFGDGILPGFVTPQRVGNDLLFEIGGQDRLTLTIAGQFDPFSNTRVETFEFADGTILSWRDVQDQLISDQATDGADRIQSFDTDDFVSARGGDDLIIASDGADIYDGGDGVDTVEFSGRASWYDVGTVGGVTTVTDRFDRDNVYTLTNVERLSFTFDDQDTILQPNQSPVAADISREISEDGAISILLSDLVAASEDPDGNTLSITSVILLENGSATLGATAVTIRPDDNFNGVLIASYTVEDAFGGIDSGTLTIIVNAINDAPEAIDDFGFSTDEDVVLVIEASDLLSNDRDIDGNALVLTSVSSAEINVGLDGDGRITITPLADTNGVFSFTYTISDGAGGTAEATASVTISAVNDDPILIATPSIIEGVGDEIIVISPLTLTETARDVDGDVVVLQSVQNAIGGNVEIDENGIVLFTPAVGFTGNASFEYTLSDGNGGVISGTQDLQIALNNTAPVISDTANLGSFDEDTSLTITSEQLLSFVSDAQGDSLSILSLTSLSDDLHVRDNQDGTYTLTSGANFNADGLQLSLTVSDGQLETSGIVEVSVSSVNDAPVAILSIDDQAFDEDTPALVELPTGLFADVDGDQLVLTASLADGQTLPDWLSFDGQAFVGTPPQDFNGILDIVVTASDGALTAQAGFQLSIDPVNDAPRLARVLDNQSGDEDVAVSFSLPSDAFADVDGDELMLTASLAGGVALPDWLSFNDGIFSGLPPADFNGVLNIVVTASDGAEQVQNTFALTINPVNDAPVIVQPLMNQASNGDAEINFTVPVEAFIDVDGDALALTATLSDGTDLPEWLLFDGAQFTGSPPAGFSGELSITVSASDGELATRSTFVLSITEVNDLYSDYDQGTDGDDFLFGRLFQNNSIYGRDGDDFLLGGLRSDNLAGGAGNDVLSGFGGNDFLEGNDGNDFLSGGLGRDILDGGSGNDVLIGGHGRDEFHFASGSGQDEILDFETGYSIWRFTSVGDEIVLDLDGVDSFSDLMRYAEQSGRDTVFDFGNGDVLVLNETRLSALDADMFTFL